jgi:holliday junction DNA helicase RuvA
MIATLTGTVAEKLGELIVLDVKGVGYGLSLPAEDFNKLATGDSAKLYIYEHVRENTYDLYGFGSLSTKQVFEQLLEVNGVGPKMALNILSIGSVDQVRGAIAGGDVKFLQSASGVGKRVAERLVVDLKDKVGLNSDAADVLLQRFSMNSKDEALQALMALGYSQEDAAMALGNIDKDLPTGERVKRALKGNAV